MTFLSRESLPGEPLAGAAEARHHLIHNQQNPVFVGERPNPGQVSGRRHENAGSTGNPLEQDRSDTRLPFALNHPLQVCECTLALLLGCRRPKL